MLQPGFGHSVLKLRKKSF